MAKHAAPSVKELRKRHDSLQERAAGDSAFESNTDKLLGLVAVLLSAGDGLTDTLAVATMARNSLAAGDMDTYESLTNLPSVHRAPKSKAQLAQLDTERLASINPAIGTALANLNGVVTDVERVYENTLRHLDAAG